MSRHKKGFWILLFLTFAQCEEVVNPELVAEDPVLVIDGLITNQPGSSYVELTKTDPFNSQTPAPRVSNALVSITDNTGQLQFFTERSSGRYVAGDPTFEGIPGRVYFLDILVDETEYTASIRMPSVPVLDSITYRLREDDLFFEDGYYLTAHFQEPISARNFYRWEIALNGIQKNTQEITLSNDETVNGLYLNLEFHVPIPLEQVESLDQFQVRLFSLSEPAYDYYRGLNLLIASGSPAQAVPENPTTNVTGGALGFFTASAVSRAVTQVRGEE